MTLFLNWYQICLYARRVSARQIFQLKRTRLSADLPFRHHFPLIKSASRETQNRPSRKLHLSFCAKNRVICQGISCTAQSLELISCTVTQPGDLPYCSLHFATLSAVSLSPGSVACCQHRRASSVMAGHADNLLWVLDPHSYTLLLPCTVQIQKKWHWRGSSCNSAAEGPANKPHRLSNAPNGFGSSTPQAPPKRCVHPKCSIGTDSGSHKVKAKQNRHFSSALCWWSFVVLGPMVCTGGVWRRRDFFPHATGCCLARTGAVFAFQRRNLEKQNHNYLVCCLQEESWASAFVPEDLLLSSLFHL